MAKSPVDHQVCKAERGEQSWPSADGWRNSNGNRSSLLASTADSCKLTTSPVGVEQSGRKELATSLESRAADKLEWPLTPFADWPVAAPLGPSGH